jgi:fatty-acid desaturase
MDLNEISREGVEWDIYIYIYIHVHVCVCMNVCLYSVCTKPYNDRSKSRNQVRRAPDFV